MDQFFRVELIAATPNPQKVCYAAMHQDYSEKFVYDELFRTFEDGTWTTPSCHVWHDPLNEGKHITEAEAGRRVVSRCVKFGHWGVIEHPQISFNVGYFPHSVMQQARTHRVGVSVDCQSFRYSGQRICDAVEASDVWAALEEVFYLRPVGPYTDRKGHRYEYTHAQRTEDLEACLDAAIRYRDRMHLGFAEEHARGLIPFDIRQHFIVTFNLRSVLHFLDLRAKADAQIEIQSMCDLIVPHIKEWVPEIWESYSKTRYKKARLAP